MAIVKRSWNVATSTGSPEPYTTVTLDDDRSSEIAVRSGLSTQQLGGAMAHDHLSKHGPTAGASDE